MTVGGAPVEVGVKAVVQPGGSVRDEQVVEAAKKADGGRPRK
ncbi:hypothetical protein ACFY5C_26695 [Streptomyces sp. NPDC012935]